MNIIKLIRVQANIKVTKKKKVTDKNTTLLYGIDYSYYNNNLHLVNWHSVCFCYSY